MENNSDNHLNGNGNKDVFYNEHAKDIVSNQAIFQLPFKATLKDIWLYCILLLRPIFFGTIFCGVWYLIKGRTEFHPADDTQLNILLLAMEKQWDLVAMLHALIATWLIYKINDQNHQIQVAFDLGDERLLRMSTSAKIGKPIKGLLFIFSFYFFVLLCRFPFYDLDTAFFFIFSTMFLIFLVWEVGSELEDPYHGIWKLSKDKVRSKFRDDYYEVPYKEPSREIIIRIENNTEKPQEVIIRTECPA